MGHGRNIQEFTELDVTLRDRLAGGFGYQQLNFIGRFAHDQADGKTPWMKYLHPCSSENCCAKTHFLDFDLSIELCVLLKTSH